MEVGARACEERASSGPLCFPFPLVTSSFSPGDMQRLGVVPRSGLVWHVWSEPLASRESKPKLYCKTSLRPQFPQL